MSALDSRSARHGCLIESGSDLASVSILEVGGKAHSLLRLHSLGFRVPAFWIVPASVLAAAATEELTQLNDRFVGSAPCSSREFEEAAQQFSSLILREVIAARLHAAIDTDLSTALQPDARYAVRSSAVGEDSTEASYAGQLDSFLNVPTKQIVATTLKVWASAYSARALAYRARRQLRHRPHEAAVIIQEMVAPVASGVMFTRHPQSGQRDCLISAAFGLGEGVVADRVASDTYRIDGRSKRIERKVVQKTTRIVADASALGGTRIEAVPLELRDQPALPDGQIIALRATGDRVEAVLNGPQDIEWALDASGRVMLLQARPIVRPQQPVPRPRPAAHHLWDNSNIIESYPGITLPLTFSFARACYAAAFGRYMTERALDYRCFGRPFTPHRHLLGRMIGLLNGRVYYNLTSWYELMSFLPGFQRVKGSWDRMIGVGETVPWRTRSVGRIRRICAWGWCAWKLATARGNARNFARRFDADYSHFAALEPDALAADELIDLYRSLARQFAEPWSATLDNDFAAMAYHEALRGLLRKWLPAQHSGLLNDLLCGDRDLESIKPLQAVAQLAAMVREDPILCKRFRSHTDGALWLALERLLPATPLKIAIDRYLKSYGDRALGISSWISWECVSARNS